MLSIAALRDGHSCSASERRRKRREWLKKHITKGPRGKLTRYLSLLILHSSRYMGKHGSVEAHELCPALCIEYHWGVSCLQISFTVDSACLLSQPSCKDSLCNCFWSGKFVHCILDHCLAAGFIHDREAGLSAGPHLTGKSSPDFWVLAKAQCLAILAELMG